MRQAILVALKNSDKRQAFEPHHGCEACVRRNTHTLKEHIEAIKRYQISVESLIPEWNNIFFS